MGYELHITRAENWMESEKTPIKIEEWLDIVNGDSEMRHDGFAEATTSEGKTIRYENQGLSVWTAYSGHEKDGNMAWFDYREGQIIVKSPDKEIIIKMYQIAQKLSAKVQGDEDEIYNESGESNWNKSEQQTEPKKAWWKLWK